MYYAGWNINSNSTQSASVGVHHPNGEPKQISFSNQTTYTNGWDNWGTHWKVYWNCIGGQGCGTEGGSSGSPLFDSNGRILGPLSGGPDVACGSSSDYALYGKLNDQWSSIDQFLDPTNSGVTFLNGTYDSFQMGCTDPGAENYDPSATQDDGSCYFEPPCDSNWEWENVVIRSADINGEGFNNDLEIKVMRLVNTRAITNVISVNKLLQQDQNSPHNTIITTTFLPNVMMIILTRGEFLSKGSVNQLG